MLSCKKPWTISKRSKSNGLQYIILKLGGPLQNGHVVLLTYDGQHVQFVIEVKNVVDIEYSSKLGLLVTSTRSEGRWHLEFTAAH